MNAIFLCWEAVESQPFGQNSFVVWKRGGNECVLVDPGFEPQKIVELIEARDLHPVANLNTHGHSDHIAGNAFIKQRWPECPLVIGAGDAEKLTDPMKNLSANFGINLISPRADRVVSEGDVLEYAGLSFHVLETPGHSLGHVVYLHSDSDPQVVLGGDVLFRQGIGRTDFPDGDHQQMMDSIKNKLYTLPDETVILPGHGPETTIGFEKEQNPFIRA